MKNHTSASELSEKLGHPSCETIEGLRLLKAFMKLSPRQRSDVVQLVKRLAAVRHRRPAAGKAATTSAEPAGIGRDARRVACLRSGQNHQAAKKRPPGKAASLRF
jgi:hypothetical protein